MELSDVIALAAVLTSVVAAVTERRRQKADVERKS